MKIAEIQLDGGWSFWYNSGISERKENEMTKKEIETRIKQEENRAKRLEDKLTDIQFDIAATKKAIEFWKEQLEKAED